MRVTITYHKITYHNIIQRQNKTSPSRHVTSTSSYVFFRDVTSRNKIMLCYIILFCGILCCIMLWYVILCYVMLCFVCQWMSRRSSDLVYSFTSVGKTITQRSYFEGWSFWHCRLVRNDVTCPKPQICHPYSKQYHPVALILGWYDKILRCLVPSV